MAGGGFSPGFGGGFSTGGGGTVSNCCNCCTCPPPAMRVMPLYQKTAEGLFINTHELLRRQIIKKKMQLAGINSKTI